MISYDSTHHQWAALPERDLTQKLYDDLALCDFRYYEMCDQGIDAHEPVRARLDAYMTGIEKLLVWSE